MPNDDLGTFPMPPQASPNPVAPVEPTPSQIPQPTAPIYPTAPVTEPIQESPIITPVTEAVPAPSIIPFEETPEEIPSSQPTPEYISTPQAEPIAETIPTEPEPQPQPEIVQPAPPTPVSPAPAVLPPKSRSSAAPIIIVVLLLVAGAGLAAATFMSAQTNKLKAQLSEITQTLEKQQTTLTPTATPTVFEIPTPTISTQSGIITPTPSATPTTPQTLNSLSPLKNAPSALQIALNHSPNAQLILIKVDNATDPTTSVTKYFFRESLTTKTYFYVAVTGTGTPEVVDKQIYVTPDDSIPTLNDAVLGNQLGLELNEAIALSIAQCATPTPCTTAPVKAQYIKTGSGIIWQLSLYTDGLSGTPLTIQINAITKAILYKSPEFASK